MCLRPPILGSFYLRSRALYLRPFHESPLLGFQPPILGLQPSIQFSQVFCPTRATFCTSWHLGLPMVSGVRFLSILGHGFSISVLKHLSSTWALHLVSILGVGFYFSLDPWAFFSLGSLHRTVWHRNRSAVLILIADTLHLLERA